MLACFFNAHNLQHTRSPYCSACNKRFFFSFFFLSDVSCSHISAVNTDTDFDRSWRRSHCWPHRGGHSLHNVRIDRLFFFYFWCVISTFVASISVVLLQGRCHEAAMKSNELLGSPAVFWHLRRSANKLRTSSSASMKKQLHSQHHHAFNRSTQKVHQVIIIFQHTQVVKKIMMWKWINEKLIRICLT